jgi:hypothetical protein
LLAGEVKLIGRLVIAGRQVHVGMLWVFNCESLTGDDLRTQEASNRAREIDRVTIWRYADIYLADCDMPRAVRHAWSELVIISLTPIGAGFVDASDV